MCWRWKSGGSSGWRKRAPRKPRREDAQLAEQVKVAFQANRRVYGSPRVHAEWRAQSIHLHPETGSSSDAGNLRLFAHRPHHCTVTTKSEPGAQVAPNEAISGTSAPISLTTSGWLIPPPCGRAIGWFSLAVCLMCFLRRWEDGQWRPFKMPLWWDKPGRWHSLVAVQKLCCSITLIEGGPPRARALKPSCNKRA